jgi:hypothetical protein
MVISNFVTFLTFRSRDTLDVRTSALLTHSRVIPDQILYTGFRRKAAQHGPTLREIEFCDRFL